MSDSALNPMQPDRATWIDFAPGPPSHSGKTQTWVVRDRAAVALGFVAWWAPWRCYSFMPNAGTVFERKCLRDIASFCELRTQERRRNV